MAMKTISLPTMYMKGWNLIFYHVLSVVIIWINLYYNVSCYQFLNKYMDPHTLHFINYTPRTFFTNLFAISFKQILRSHSATTWLVLEVFFKRNLGDWQSKLSFSVGRSKPLRSCLVPYGLKLANLPNINPAVWHKSLSFQGSIE